MTDHALARRMPRGRYFIMRPDGTFWSTKPSGKGMRFAFEQLPAARVQAASREGAYIFDRLKD